jgi:hypothetical protein
MIGIAASSDNAATRNGAEKREGIPSVSLVRCPAERVTVPPEVIECLVETIRAI